MPMKQIDKILGIPVKDGRDLTKQKKGIAAGNGNRSQLRRIDEAITLAKFENLCLFVLYWPCKNSA